jgi:hypothetical protein
LYCGKYGEVFYNMEVRNVDELVCENFHRNYGKDEQGDWLKVGHRDGNLRNLHIDNLIFKGRYERKAPKATYVLSYDLDNGQQRLLYENDTKEIVDVDKIDNDIYPRHYHLLPGCEPRDEHNKKLPMTTEHLEAFAKNFKQWVSELRPEGITYTHGELLNRYRFTVTVSQLFGNGRKKLVRVDELDSDSSATVCP